MLRKAIIGAVLLAIALGGCSGEAGNFTESSSTKYYAIPADYYDYGVFDQIRIYEAVNVRVGPGQTAGFYTRFHYAPRQTDKYFGDYLAQNGEDFAKLNKPLYQNSNAGISYKDAILEVRCYDPDWQLLEPQPAVSFVSYDPLTQTVYLDGFPHPGKCNFTISYLHSLPATFGVWYMTPPSEYDYTYWEGARGYKSDDKVRNWVSIDGQIMGNVTVQPFEVKHIPITITPIVGECESGEKYKFKLVIGEIGLEGSMPVAAGVEQWWLITISGGSGA